MKAVTAIDDAATTAVLAAPKNAVAEAHREVKEAYRESKATGRRAIDDDFECAANFVHHDGAVYVLLHAEMQAYHALFQSMPGVEEYRCALHCSEPQWGIPEGEWRERAAIWGKVLAGARHGPLGLHFELIGHYLPQVEPEQIMSKLPDLDGRLERLARKAAWAGFYAAKAGDDPSIREMTDLVFKFDEWCKTDAGVNVLHKHTNRLRGVIRHQLDAVDLWGFDIIEEHRRAKARLEAREENGLEDKAPPPGLR